MKTELIIGRSPNYYLIPVLDGAEWATEDAGIAGSFTFLIPPVKDLYINEGDIVKFKVNGKKVFAGYVFTQEWDKSGVVKVTAYDSLRYLKSKDTYNFIGKTASEILTQIATEHQIPVGDITDTKYRIPSMIMVNLSLFDIIYKAMKLTEKAGYGKFILYDDFGKLSLKHETEMVTDVLIDISTAQDFLFTSDINKETYNIIKLVENGESIVVKDENTVREWGDLQYFGTVENGENAQEKAKVLLEMFNKRHKTLTVKNALGDPSVRGGSIISVKLNLGGEKVDNLMYVKECRHIFNQGYFMRLVLAGYALPLTPEAVVTPETSTVMKLPKPPAEYAQYAPPKATEPPETTEPEYITNIPCTVQMNTGNDAVYEKTETVSRKRNATGGGNVSTVYLKVNDTFSLHTLNSLILESAEVRAKLDPFYEMPSRVIKWTIPETDVIKEKSIDLIKCLKPGNVKITGITSDRRFWLVADLTIISSQYSVSYDANGGSYFSLVQTKYHGVSLTLSTSLPQRNGYTFVYWALNPDGTGARYNPGGVYTANKSTVLYAVWEEKIQVKEGDIIADITTAWYEWPFNDFDKYQCTWYVAGRIGEVHNVKVGFTRKEPSPSGGGGDGGWWVDNANDIAYIWKDNQLTTEYKTVIKERDSDRIEAGSAVCFKYYVAGDYYGHVVYVEAVEKIGDVTYVSYSHSYVVDSEEELITGIIYKKPLNTIDNEIGFLQSWPNFQGYIKIE